MGGCLSTNKPNYISNTNGGEEDFYNLYLEDKLLGEGEFGMVKLVHDMKTNQVYAVKMLRKGMVFKDNVVYSPLKPHVLQAEVDMLRTLQGQYYCLKLIGVYESPKHVYLVTELCSGGEMMHYVSQQEELRTEHVSRITFQLLHAVHHCATHNIIHRDVKPDNIMFLNNDADSDCRLIDFGSGCMDVDGPPEFHTTFAGSAFYISPEMFQRTYTYKTDVWSCGVALYVLVAGYPADELQKAFNILQKSKNRNLQTLPNLPNDMPDSFYNLLESLLTYHHKGRPSAGELLNHEFVQFHKQHALLSIENDNDTVVQDSFLPNKNSTMSMSLTSSVKRHGMFLDYVKFERSVTTLLATLLSQPDFDRLLGYLERQQGGQEEEQVPMDVSTDNQPQKLNIIQISELKRILKELKQEKCLSNISQLPNADNYQGFAYHVELLQQFKRETNILGAGMERRHSFSGTGDKKEISSSVHGSDVFNKNRKSRDRSDNLNNSWHVGQTGGR